MLTAGGVGTGHQHQTQPQGGTRHQRPQVHRLVRQQWRQRPPQSRWRQRRRLPSLVLPGIAVSAAPEHGVLVCRSASASLATRAQRRCHAWACQDSRPQRVLYVPTRRLHCKTKALCKCYKHVGRTVATWPHVCTCKRERQGSEIVTEENWRPKTKVALARVIAHCKSHASRAFDNREAAKRVPLAGTKHIWDVVAALHALTRRQPP